MEFFAGCLPLPCLALPSYNRSHNATSSTLSTLIHITTNLRQIVKMNFSHFICFGFYDELFFFLFFLWFMIWDLFINEILRFNHKMLNAFKRMFVRIVLAWLLEWCKLEFAGNRREHISILSILNFNQLIFNWLWDE